MIRRSKVDLPQPLGPMSTVVCPRLKSDPPRSVGSEPRTRSFARTRFAERSEAVESARSASVLDLMRSMTRGQRDMTVK